MGRCMPTDAIVPKCTYYMYIRTYVRTYGVHTYVHAYMIHTYLTSMCILVHVCTRPMKPETGSSAKMAAWQRGRSADQTGKQANRQLGKPAIAFHDAILDVALTGLGLWEVRTCM